MCMHLGWHAKAQCLVSKPAKNSQKSAHSTEPPHNMHSHMLGKQGFVRCTTFTGAGHNASCQATSMGTVGLGCSKRCNQPYAHHVTVTE